MATGKKGKKPKTKTLNLQEFLSESGTGGASNAQVTKNISWSDECYDFDDWAAPPKIVSVLLPTAPRSTRVLDDSTIPQNPPYLAYMSNLPYDLNEQDLQEFFEEQLECEVVSVRLPREDGDTGRMRGFGYVEFREREHLIGAVSLPDPQLRNRKIRIDVSTEQDQKRVGGRGRYDNFGASNENRDTDWRRGGSNSRQQEDGEYGARRGGFGHNRERPRDSSQEGGGGGGNWRSGDRPRNESPPPAPPMRRDRDPRDRDPRERDSGRDRYGGRRNGYDERPRRDEPVPEERPRLKLQPRTVPLPEFKPEIEDDEEKPEVVVKEPPAPRPKPVPSAAIFGAAKPVDTAAKDRAIEERLERERLQKQKEEEENAKREQEQKELEKEQQNEEPKDEEPSANGVEGEVETDGDREKPEPAAAPVAEKKEAISWRRKSDDPDESARTQSPPRRRYSPNRRHDNRRNDDRRGPRDRRDDNRDHRDHRDNRDNRDHRDNRDRRDHHANRDQRDYRDGQRSDRDKGGEQFNRERNYNRGDKLERPLQRDPQNRGPPPNRDDRPVRRRDERDERDENIENRMPKYTEDVKPKLPIHNTYGVFDQEEASD